jgi:hypothetical protein
MVGIVGVINSEETLSFGLLRLPFSDEAPGRLKAPDASPARPLIGLSR